MNEMPNQIKLNQPTFEVLGFDEDELNPDSEQQKFRTMALKSFQDVKVKKINSINAWNQEKEKSNSIMSIHINLQLHQL